MPQDVTILSVLPDPNVWGHDHEHGPFVDYYLTANDGSKDWFCLWRRKPDSPAPQEGDTLFADLNYWKDSKKGNAIYKLKPAQRPDGSSGSSVSRPAQQGGSRNGDERGARIERQHSQEMALRLLTLHGADTADLVALKGQVKELTDHFCADLDQASISNDIPIPPPDANGGPGSDQPSQSTAGPSRSTLASIAAACVENDVRLALVAAGATDVGDIPKAIDSLTPQQLVVFESSLGDLSHQRDEGVEVPVSVGARDDDDIPF